VKAFLTLLAASVLVIGPGKAAPGLATSQPGWLVAAQGAKTMAFAISSTSFHNGGDIAKKFTCEGDDVSPELSWTQPPAGTQTFALIADDPDAPVGTWARGPIGWLSICPRCPPACRKTCPRLTSFQTTAATRAAMILAKSAMAVLALPRAKRTAIFSSSTHWTAS